jgi:hypothetical protein
MIHDSHLSCQCSYFRGSYDPTPVDTRNLAAVLSAITSDTYAHQITWLRNTLRSHGKGIYDHYKKRLDAVTFGGTFAPTRAKDHLTQHSGLVHLDYDGVHDVAGAKAVLCAVPALAYAFISPSGCGLKVGVRVTPVSDDSAYKHAWQSVADHFEHQYGIMADSSGTDISRLCFVSWDPDAYVNLDAEVFPLPLWPEVFTFESKNSSPSVPPPRPPLPPPRPASPATDRRAHALQQAITRAVRLIEHSRPATPSTPGTRHRNRLKAARLLGGYVAGGLLTHTEAYAILAAVVRHHTTHFDRSMRTIADGLQYGALAPVYFEDLEQERLAWCAAHGYTSAQRGAK